MLRRDLRNCDQSRKTSIRLGGVLEVDGACQLTQGQTTVLATIAGPAQPRYSRHEDSDKCTIEVEVNMAGGSASSSSSSSSSASSAQEIVLSQLIQRVLSSCVKLESFPRLLIVVKVLVLRNDGSLFSTALNACTLALLDAATPMHYFAPCVEMALVGEHMLVDPTQQEAQQSQAGLIVALAGHWAGTDASDIAAKTLALEVDGTISHELLTQSLDLAEKCAMTLSLLFRDALEKKFERPRN